VIELSIFAARNRCEVRALHGGWMCLIKHRSEWWLRTSSTVHSVRQRRSTMTLSKLCSHSAAARPAGRPRFTSSAFRCWSFANTTQSTLEWCACYQFTRWAENFLL